VDAQQLVAQGDAQYKAGDTDGAMASYNQAIETDPFNAEVYIHRGIVRRAKGDITGAIEDYNEGLQLNPQSVSGYVNRGIARRMNNDMAGAIEDYSAALRLKPDDQIALNNRGYTRFEMGDYDGAVADCSEAIRINPRHPNFYHSRGMAYASQGKTLAAAADFRQTLSLKPDHPEADYMRLQLSKWEANTQSPNNMMGVFSPADIPPTEQPNLMAGIGGGVVAAVGGAVAWGIITALSNYKLGIVAIGIGFLVGYAVRTFGKGYDTSFGIAGAILALFGCIGGNIVAIYFIAMRYEPDVAPLLLSHLDALIQVFIKFSSPMDIIFYGIALYEGYRFSVVPPSSLNTVMRR